MLVLRRVVISGARRLTLASYSTVASGTPSAKMACQRQNITSQTGDYVAREVSGERIDLSVGQPSPSSLPLRAMAAAAAHRLGSSDAELLLQYGPRQGYRSFRRSLAEFLSQRYGTAVQPENLMVTAGVSHGLDLAVGALSRPGDVILLECPTYFLVTPIFRDNHLTVVAVPTDEYGMVVDELEKWLAANPSSRPRLLYTIPIHNNPRGTTLPPRRRRQLLQLAHLHDFLVLADEVYQLLTFTDVPGDGGGGGDDTTPASDGAPEAAAAVPAVPADGLPSPLPLPMRCYEECDPRVSRVVSFGSFSKMLAPALRLGWIETTNPTLLERLKGDGVISSGGCIAQMSAGLAHSALELGLQAAHLEDVVRPGLAARCHTLVSALRRHLPPGACRSLLEPRGGYFLWLELPEQVDSRSLLQLAERHHGVRFTPGPACGGGAANCLRLSFSFYSEQELEEGARRLGEAVREYMAAQEEEQGHGHGHVGQQG